MQYRILTLGLAPKAKSLLDANIEPKTVAKILTAENPEALEKGGVSELTTRDVREFKEHLDTLEASEVALTTKGGLDEKRVAAQVQERIQEMMDLMKTINSLMVDTVADYRRELALREAGEVRLDKHGNPHRVEYPAAQMHVLMKAITVGSQLIDRLQGDKGVQSFIKSATVNVQASGMSFRDLYAILTYMAKELNVPHERFMQVFSDAQEALSARQGPIDVPSNRQ